jgi:hypothetical protein
MRTTIDRRGRFTRNEVAVSSGSGSVDRDALQLMRSTDYLSHLMPKPIEPQTGYLVVRADKSGAVTLGFTGKLLEKCPSQSEVESDPAGT